jgi:hypothetical protein
LSNHYDDTPLGLIARKGFNSLTAPEKKEICNGAGPGGKGWWNRFLTWLLPNEFYGLDLTPVFNIHDHDYHTGGSNWGFKLVADMVMFANCMIMIWRAGRHNRWKRTRRAIVYFIGVSIGGKKSYKYQGVK